MRELTPGTTFRGLPFTTSQEREVEHFIEEKRRLGQEWNTPELSAMIADMLDPPELSDDDQTGLDRGMSTELDIAMHEESSEVDQLPSERERDRQH